MLADMLCGAIGCIGFSWVTNTLLCLCISRLSVSLDSYLYAEHLRALIAFWVCVSGCQPSLYRTGDSDVRLAGEDAATAWAFYSWDSWPWRRGHPGKCLLCVFMPVYFLHKCGSPYLADSLDRQSKPHLLTFTLPWFKTYVKPSQRLKFRLDFEEPWLFVIFVFIQFFQFIFQFDFQENKGVSTHSQLSAPEPIFISNLCTIDLSSLSLPCLHQLKIGRKLPFNMSSTGRQRWRWWRWDCFVWQKAKH